MRVSPFDWFEDPSRDGAVFAFYLNFVVLIVRSFQKVPARHALAPKQTELPFLVAQIVLLVAVLVLGALAVRRFRAEPLRAAESRSFLLGDQS